MSPTTTERRIVDCPLSHLVDKRILPSRKVLPKEFNLPRQAIHRFNKSSHLGFNMPRQAIYRLNKSGHLGFQRVGEEEKEGEESKMFVFMVLELIATAILEWTAVLSVP